MGRMVTENIGYIYKERSCQLILVVTLTLVQYGVVTRLYR